MHCTQAAEAEELSFLLNLVKNTDVDWLEKKLYDLFVLKSCLEVTAKYRFMPFFVYIYNDTFAVKQSVDEICNSYFVALLRLVYS